MPESPRLSHCRHCRWFYITHQPAHPYGCRAMGFASSRLPCQVVYESSGMACQAFSPKNKTQKTPTR